MAVALCRLGCLRALVGGEVSARLGFMAWTVCIPTLKRYDLLVRLCLSLNSERCRDLNLRICILDNGGGLLDSSLWCTSQAQFVFARPEVIVPKYNLGVAGSWNFFLQNFGACIIANDDVVFAEGTIDSFASASMAYPEVVIFEGKDPVAGFSTFYVNKPDIWLRMGGFDELLNPAYFEDNDCRHRLRLAGNPVKKIFLNGWRHDNSSTLASADESYQRMHWCLYQRNRTYYIHKWGGLPGRETNIAPFANPSEE